MANDQRSIFETLKRFDKEGREIWTARELRVGLGYVSWQNFSYPLDKAKALAKAKKIDIGSNFMPFENPANRRRERDDYKLTKLACCLIAECADKDKEGVVEAIAYFSDGQKSFPVQLENQDKTRIEAPVPTVLNQPAGESKLRELELVNEGLRLQIELNKTQLQLEEHRKKVIANFSEATQQKILGYVVISKDGSKKSKSQLSLPQGEELLTHNGQQTLFR